MLKKFLIVGNDKKMLECKNRLISRGFKADIKSGKDVLINAVDNDCLILPLPTVSNGYITGTNITIGDLAEKINNNQYIFYGNLSNVPECNYISYYYNEAFLIKNSQLTSQGVLKLILDSIDCSLHDMKVAVLGYGRCGKMIANVLNGVGMDVTVFSRRYETMILTHYDGFMFENINSINDLIYKFKVIVNTVPDNIISNEGIRKLSAENIYIEVASKPYGFNINNTDVYNFKYILGESLPGRFTAKSAGINIADTVIEILKEVDYG